MYQHQQYQEQQAKAQAVQRMIDAGEMVPGANLTFDSQNEQQVSKRREHRQSARQLKAVHGGAEDMCVCRFSLCLNRPSWWRVVE